MVIEIDGSSTVSGGSGRGSFGSARVSPIMMSSMPAMATSSPGPALSAGVRVRPSVTSSSVILTFLIVPSVLHQATCWPFFIVAGVDAQQRQAAEVGRGVEVGDLRAQRLLGVVDRRAGSVSSSVFTSGPRSGLSGEVPSAGRVSEACPVLPLL